jgi:serine/threonine protein phosphatase PrpC
MDWSWRSSAITDVGKVRKINEDNLLDASDAGYWIVADGMGGHDSGDVASTKIVENCSGLDTSEGLSGLVNAAERNLLKVNSELVEIARAKNNNSIIGSTVVGLFVEEGWGVCLWAGDSRLYCLRDGRLTSISRDHTDVEDLVDRGEVLREDAESHPLANVINRAVGGGDELFVDAKLIQIENNDRYLLCSDGLYKEMTEPEFAEVLKDSPSVAESTRRLVDISLERGCRDNISVIVIDFFSDGSLDETSATANKDAD